MGISPSFVRNDAIVIPIIGNYRHGIELALKDEIRDAAA